MPRNDPQGYADDCGPDRDDYDESSVLSAAQCLARICPAADVLEGVE